MNTFWDGLLSFFQCMKIFCQFFAVKTPWQDSEENPQISDLQVRFWDVAFGSHFFWALPLCKHKGRFKRGHL